VAPAVVVHSGGPTPVLNASLQGVIEAFDGGELYGARHGVEGLLSGDLIDLKHTPVTMIGTSRRRVTDYERLFDQLRARDIHTLFLTGGNGSMAAGLSISRHAGNYELQIIGIPKTIDNDLLVTHHTPGYHSTANFFIGAARDAGFDNKMLPSPICILETLGRNVGWIVAATAFARNEPDDAPHLICYPERMLDLDRMAADVEAVYRRLGRCFITVCEGHPSADALAPQLSARLGLRVRAERPGLTGRSCTACVKERDRREAYECGRAAVAAAERGEHDVMVALHADGSNFLTSLESVAGKQRALPLEWIDDPDQFRDYFLAGGGG
jgi:6-phosphofructokinase